MMSLKLQLVSLMFSINRESDVTQGVIKRTFSLTHGLICGSTGLMHGVINWVHSLTYFVINGAYDLIQSAIYSLPLLIQTVKTLVRPSALFEAVWVRSHIPLMAPWVRPDPPSMKPWVKLDVSFILAIRTISKIIVIKRTFSLTHGLICGSTGLMHGVINWVHGLTYLS
jgi:hypothetical protein